MFIGHEYIIHSPFSALKGENAFQALDTRPMTEGLSAYYNERLTGIREPLDPQRRYYFEFFKACSEKDRLSPVELCRLALS